MGNRHVLRSGNEQRLAMPERPTRRSGAHFASAATLARMAQDATIPNIPVARRPPHRQRTRVRPYVRTGGRTQSTRNLAIEAMVSVRTASPLINAEFRSSDYRTAEFRTLEYEYVLAVCHRPKSVAEVAAALSVPLGVAKVLLGDMADLGLVIVHDANADGDGRPALALMERVLNGLRRL